MDSVEQRQMVQLLADLCVGLEPWRDLWPEVGELLPRRTDRSEYATMRRTKLLRKIVERAERMAPRSRP